MTIKTFNVDWDSYEDVTRLASIIKSRLGEINPNHISKRERNRRLLDACESIYNTDIATVYANMNLDPLDRYYVYVHMDPTRKIAIGADPLTSFAATLGMTHMPFYVGKGTGSRSENLNRNGFHRKIRQRLESIKREPIAQRIAEGLTERDALALESKLIDIFGIIPQGGLLANLDEGIERQSRRMQYQKYFELLTCGARSRKVAKW